MERNGPSVHSGTGALLGLGLRGALDAASLIQNEEEDEEQRRNRIQAEENGEDLGAALGTILGLASTLLDDQEISPEEESPDFTMKF